jgi:hypothetical protein
MAPFANGARGARRRALVRAAGMAPFSNGARCPRRKALVRVAGMAPFSNGACGARRRALVRVAGMAPFSNGACCARRQAFVRGSCIAPLLSRACWRYLQHQVCDKQGGSRPAPTRDESGRCTGHWHHRRNVRYRRKNGSTSSAAISATIRTSSASARAACDSSFSIAYVSRMIASLRSIPARHSRPRKMSSAAV